VTSVREYEDELQGYLASAFTGQTDVPGLSTWEDIQATILMWDVGAVYQTSVPEDQLRSALTDSDPAFSETGVHHGFTLFEQSNRKVAVRNNLLIVGGRIFGDEDEGDSNVETLINTRVGVTESYSAAHPSVETIISNLSEGDVTYADVPGYCGRLPGTRAEGYTYHLGEEDTTTRVQILFEEGQTDEEAVEEWYANNRGIFEEREPTVESTGQLVTAEATIETSALDYYTYSLPSRSIETPTAAFEFDYQPQSDTEGGILEIRHDGGDTLSSSSLFIDGDGFETISTADQTQAGTWKGEVSGADESVVESDTVRVGVAPDYFISIRWEHQRCSASITLASDTGPEE
jgi:hypothetical protein